MNAGLLRPALMPDALRERIAGDVRTIAAEPNLRVRPQNLGMTARAETPTEFAAAVEADRAHWAEAARAYGAKPER